MAWFIMSQVTACDSCVCWCITFYYYCCDCFHFGAATWGSWLVGCFPQPPLIPVDTMRGVTGFAGVPHNNMKLRWVHRMACLLSLRLMPIMLVPPQVRSSPSELNFQLDNLCWHIGVCFMLTGSNVVTFNTNGFSPIRICTTMSLWSIPLVGICASPSVLRKGGLMLCIHLSCQPFYQYDGAVSDKGHLLYLGFWWKSYKLSSWYIQYVEALSIALGKKFQMN